MPLPDWMHYCDSCNKAISKRLVRCVDCVEREHEKNPESMRDFRKRVIDPQRTAGRG